MGTGLLCHGCAGFSEALICLSRPFPNAKRSCRMRGATAWLPDDESAPAAVDTKTAVADSLVIPMAGDASPFCQLIYKGCAKRSVPSTELPENICADVSETRWATTATLDSLLSELERRTGPGSCMMLWDMVPVRYSRETMDMVRASHPYCHICFIDRHATSHCQPADRCYMRSLEWGPKRVCHGGCQVLTCSRVG